MRQMARIVSVALLVLVPGAANRAPAAAPPVPATLLSQDWDTGTLGWTLSNSDTSTGWAADGTPAADPVIGTPYVSAPYSLNYNNGLDYDVPDPANHGSGLPNSGTATSPVVDLAGTTNPVLTFRCNYFTETDDTSWGTDERRLQISKDDFATTLFDELLGTVGAAPAIGACSSFGSWHTHTVSLHSAWGSIRVRFAFDTIDDFENVYAGWFVDDVEVTADVPAPPPPPAPQPALDPLGDGKDDGPCSSGVPSRFGGSLWPAAVLALLAGIALRRLRA